MISNAAKNAQVSLGMPIGSLLLQKGFETSLSPGLKTEKGVSTGGAPTGLFDKMVPAATLVVLLSLEKGLKLRVVNASENRFCC